MAEAGKPKLIAVCGGYMDVWNGKTNKSEDTFEERMKRKKPPVECSTSENSEKLHQMYKDSVKHTEPDADKTKAMTELMSHLHSAEDVHNTNVEIAKKSSTGLKRRPSTLGHLVHDDSDDETEQD